MSEEAQGKPEQTPKHKPAVAAVLNSDRVALNIGSDHGVKLGQRYLIYELSDYEITDPTTGESLGRVEIPKGTGRIANVQKKISTLESDKELPPSERGLSSLSVDIAELMTPGRMAPFRNPREGDRVKRLVGF